MTPKEVAKVVAVLAAAYPHAKVTTDTSKAYESQLQDLDFEETKNACARLMATSEWMPTIAKIRSAVLDLRVGPKRTGAEAYAIVLQAIRKFGDDAPKFADPLIPRCIGVWGSWSDLCRSPEDDPGGRARFIDMYDSLAERERATAVSGRALPEPQARREFWLERRQAPELQAPPVATPVERRAHEAPMVRVRHPDPTPRRWTAEEIEAELGRTP